MTEKSKAYALDPEVAQQIAAVVWNHLGIDSPETLNEWLRATNIALRTRSEDGEGWKDEA